MSANNSGLHSTLSLRGRIRALLRTDDFKGSGVQRWASGGDDVASCCRLVAIPRGDNAASSLNDRHKGCDIIGLKSRIHSDIDEARSEHRKKISIAAESRHARRIA